MDRQCDHHCRIRMGNSLWRITAKQGLRLLLDSDDTDRCRAVIDMTGFNFDAYAAAAVLNDYAETIATERGAIPAPISRRVH